MMYAYDTNDAHDTRAHLTHDTDDIRTHDART